MNKIKPLSVGLRPTLSDLAAGSHLSHLSFCKQSQGACGGQPVAWVTVCCRSSGPPSSLSMPRLSTGWPGAFRVPLPSGMARRHTGAVPGLDQTLSPRQGGALLCFRQPSSTSKEPPLKNCPPLALYTSENVAHSFIHFSYLPNYCFSASVATLWVPSSVPLFQLAAMKSQNTFSC